MAGETFEHKVLFLVHQYEPQPKVCELCVMRVQNSLKKIGVKSDVLEFAGTAGLLKNTECGDVYSIGASKPRVDTTQKNIIWEYIKKIPITFRWPYLYNNNIRKSYKHYIDALNKINKYDAIIGVTLPVDTAIIASEYDNFIHYELDSVANNPEYKRGIKKLYKKRLERIEKYLYETAQLIIHMEYNKKYLEKYKLSSFANKFVYSDIPNLVQANRCEENKCIDKGKFKVRMAYFGALVKDYRSPEYLIQVLTELNNRMPVECEFFSRGNCEEILTIAADRNPDIIYQRGYVDQDTVKREQNKTEFLISIGNRLSGNDYSLPSKIIEYFALGKPIIHVHGGKNDSAIPYLEKYGLACVINPEDDLDSNVHEIIRFINDARGKLVSFEKVEKIFYHNSPDYTAEVIKDFILRSKEGCPGSI